MSTEIYPCLWFNTNAKEAATFYCSVFKNAKIVQDTPMVSTFELDGCYFMGLNGGPKYAPNSAVSYYVYCGSEAEITRIYNAFIKKAKVLMPLDSYAWSEKYAWIIDEFGVNWQLDVHDIQSNQKIVPNFLFANAKMQLVKDAINHYNHIFNPSKILLEALYPPNPDIKEGTLLFAQLKLNDFICNAMSSTLQHDFDFSPGNSLVVNCETQAQIDYYWEKLGEGGGRACAAGWPISLVFLGKSYLPFCPNSWPIRKKGNG